jgi:AraC family transcriptional regulator, 4-hydroxyphenylacetate 3-monooxygenase operon regulatory protein
LNLIVDGSVVHLMPHQVICLTYLQKVFVSDSEVPFYVLMFNREFYCIHTNDREVSCNGLLFFGSDKPPVLSLDKEEKRRIETLIHVLTEEFETVDVNQEEMLRILLKRLIIRTARLARNQLPRHSISDSQIDIVRQFFALVEEHYQQKRQVSEYADLMNKSPKTLTNLFRLYNEKSPLQIIFDRIMLEAKRLLLYTGLSAKEISYKLGFEDQAHFSKFFKKQAGLTISDFSKAGIIENSGKIDKSQGRIAIS